MALVRGARRRSAFGLPTHGAVGRGGAILSVLMAVPAARQNRPSSEIFVVVVICLLFEREKHTLSVCGAGRSVVG